MKIARRPMRPAIDVGPDPMMCVERYPDGFIQDSRRCPLGHRNRSHYNDDGSCQCPPGTPPEGHAVKAWIYCRLCNAGFDGEATPEGYVLGDDVCPGCGNKLRATSPAFAEHDDDRFVLTDKGLAAIGKAPVTT